MKRKKNEYEAGFMRKADLDEPPPVVKRKKTDPFMRATDLDEPPPVVKRKKGDAGFTRAADIDEPAPEELLREATGKARLIKIIVALSVVVVIAAASYAAWWLRRDTPEKQVERGIAYSATNSHPAAIIEFKRALQENPDQPRVRVLLGQELSMLGDAKGAEIEFRKAADAHYEPDKTLPLLGAALLHQAQFEKVIDFVNSATIDSPEANAELLAMRGSSYFALGRFEEAQASWKAANEFVPGNPATVMAQTRALMSKGSFDEASKTLATISPDAPKVELLALRGELARARGERLEAVKNYEEAIKIEPGNLFIRESLAEIFIELSRFDEAAAEVKPILLRKPKYANAHFLNALVAIGRNDMQEASNSITEAVHLTPTDGRYQLVAGKIALQFEHYADAEGYLRDAVTALPRNIEARRLLAVIYIDRHEGNKADDVFRPVFESARNNREYAMIQARIAILQGDTLAAAHDFDLVDPSDPANVDAILFAASLRFKAGAKASGFALLDTARKASPDNPDVDSAIIMSHLTFHETKEALAAWDVLAQKQPKAARTYNLLAAIDLARGDKAAARNSMQQAVDADPRYLAPVTGLAMLDLGDKKPDDAKARLRKFIATNPTNAEATLLLIQVEKANGNNPDVIIGLLRDSLKANPKSAQMTYALVDYYVEHGDVKQALAVANEGLSFAPDNSSLLQFVGDQALASDDNALAITIFGKLVDKNPSSPDYPTRLGLAQLAAGHTEETLTNFRLALTRDPYNQQRQLALVGTLLGAGKGDEAARMLFEISRLSPKSPVIPELDADVKLGLKQFPEALAAYKKALAQRPSSRLAIKNFNGLMTARLRGEAYAFMSDWLKTHPNDETVRLYSGEDAMRTKDYAKAIAQFRTLLAAHPNDPYVLNNLAWCLARTNDPQALPTAEKASAIAPNNPSISDTLGWLLVEQGDADRGLSLIEKAERGAPNQLEIRFHLAKAQLKKGRNADARATLQSVVAKAPESEEGKASRALLATFDVAPSATRSQ